MKFSIAMTAFDTYCFLPRAIACVLQQEHVDWELLLVCDGPTPSDDFDPERMLARARRRAPGRRMECWRLPRAEGCYGNVARRFALEQATGDYVCWVNHDNLIAPRYLAAHAENIRKSPGCVSVVDIAYWRNAVPHGPFPRALRRSRIDLLNFAAPTELCRRVDAFGDGMSREYAADWRVFDALRRLAPVERRAGIVGTHF